MNAYETSQSWPDIPGVMGDVQEERRKRLESEVTGRLRDLSLERSSTDYSVEYPRHAPLPDVSYDYRRSGGATAGVGDDSLASPHDTFSTTAHHASNITVRGGLRGRIDADSPSLNAEYDPDRKLDAMLCAQHNLSIFNESPSHIRFVPVSTSPPILRKAVANSQSSEQLSDRHPSKTAGSLVHSTDTALISVQSAPDTRHLPPTHHPRIHPLPLASLPHSHTTSETRLIINEFVHNANLSRTK